MGMVSLGQDLVSGRPAMGCPHMQEWLPLFTQLQISRGRIKRSLDIFQALGNAPASGATHLQGTALDIKQLDAGLIADAREAGARGTWPRGPQWGQKNMPIHTHLSLDCPCTSGSDYQIIAADAGYNGLGYRGEGGRDYMPAPRVRRDWAAGMEWMRGQLAAAGRHRTVTVARGATLGGIAAALGVSLAALLSVNPQITNPNVITPGQTITVPQGAPAVPALPVVPAPTSTTPPVTVTPKAPVTTKPAPKSSTLIKAGVRSARVAAYQASLRRLVGPAVARKLNPSGATGYYGPQTKALTRAAYQALARQNPRGGWLRGDLSVPGPKLLKRLGL